MKRQRKHWKIHCKHGHALIPENRTPGGACLTCNRIRARKWVADNPEKDKAKKNVWIKENPERFKAIQRKHIYGINDETFKGLLKFQKHRCAGCGIKFGKKHLSKLSIDHDHACCKGRWSCGKCLRGLLCLGCNAALGMLKDDPKILKRLIHYLTRKKLAPPLEKFLGGLRDS